MGYNTIAYSAETVVFIFLGMGLFAFNHPYDKMGPGLFIGTIFILNIARFLNIYLVSFLLNKCRNRSDKIN